VSTGIGKHYSGEAGKGYADWQVRWHESLAHIVARKFQPYVGAADTVLDFGCGGGANLAAISCARRLGVEPNPHSAQSAIARGIEVTQTLEPVAPQSVDVVISHHALEHTLRPYDELVAMRRVLKRDGRVVVVLPIDDWRSQRRFDSEDINHHLYTWTPLLIGNLLVEAGYAVVESRVSNFTWPPKVHLSDKVLPRPVFDAMAALWSHVTRIREVVAVAKLL